MRSSIIIPFVLLIASSCIKEEKKQSHFVGFWELTSVENPDTSVVVFVNSEGVFDYRFRYLHFSGKVEGEIDKNGEVDGNLKSGVIIVGSLSGNVKVDSGNGHYYISGQEIPWSVKKID